MTPAHLAAVPLAPGGDTAANIIGFLVGAVVICGGLWRVAAALWRGVQSLRDNIASTDRLTRVTDELAGKVTELHEVMNGRFAKLEERVDVMERSISALVPRG